jgi:hypothetical protein
MKVDTATLVDVKLVLSTPVHTETKRSGYVKAQVKFADSVGHSSLARRTILLHRW